MRVFKVKNSLLPLISLIILSSCNIKYPEFAIAKLTVAVLKTEYELIDEMVEDFNSGNLNYKLQVVQFDTESEKLDFIKSGNSDLVLFSNAHDGHKVRNFLKSLSRIDSLRNYRKNIIDFISIDNNLYSIPSPGLFYANAISAEFERKYFAYPNTIDELITNVTNYYQTNPSAKPIHNIIGSNETKLINSLLEVALPMFLYSVEGRNFINNYVLHNVKMSDDKFKNIWTDIFAKYKTLYNVGYYNLNEFKIGGENVTDFENGQYQSLEINPSSEIFNNISDDKYSLKPFIGNDSDQQWIATKPMYYLSACKNNRGNFNGVEAFVDYYVSPENQNIIKYSMSKTNVPYFVSFFNNDTVNKDKTKYNDIDSCLKRNHIIIADTFLDVFKNSSGSLKKYIEGTIDANTLIGQIDEIVFEEELNHEN